MQQEMTQSLKDMMDDMIGDVHTCIPAKVTSFDAGANEVDVKPLGSLTINGERHKYPAVTDIPVCWPLANSGIGISFPIKKGDLVLLLISEVDLDETKDDTDGAGEERFSLQNAIAIPGLMKNGSGVISDANSEDAVMVEYKGTKLAVKASGVEITGDLKVTGTVTAPLFDGTATRARTIGG